LRLSSRRSQTHSKLQWIRPPAVDNKHLPVSNAASPGDANDGIRDRVGAVVLTNSGTWDELIKTGSDLTEAALEELPPALEAWMPEEQPPAEIEPLLGRWWSEGSETIFSWRDGKLEARLAGAPAHRAPSVFELEGDDRYRVVSGRERGEVLTVVRDEQGAVVRLYWATYPFTREPETFG